MIYPRAPITEAILELRFAAPFPQKTVEAAASRIAKDYFYSEAEQSINFMLEANNAKIENSWQGTKLSSLDRVDITIFRTSAFVCSRLAPYCGWDEFIARAAQGWAAWKKESGTNLISRIGLRYVNRIDVPIDAVGLINAEDYLTLTPRSPDFAGPMLTYTMQMIRPLGVDDCNALMTSGTVPSPLVGFASLALDIDVYKEAGIPKRDDELWDLVGRMRNYKNTVFESCITDRARALFNS